MQLKYFLAVCEHGTVSAAAEDLHIAQPSLSIAIKELEGEFGVSLFCRTHRGMQLTGEGEQFLAMCADIVERTERTERIMKEMGRERKSLRLGVPPMIGSLVLPLIYKDFVLQSPDLSVEIIECGGESAAKMLRDGLIDMAFVSHSGEHDADMESVRLDELEIVCGASSDNPIVKEGPVSPRMLGDVPLVMYKDGFFQSRKIKNWFAGENVEPYILVTTNQLSTMTKLVSSGTAIGFIFDKLVKNEEKIKCFSLDPPITLSVSLVWQKNKPLFSGMKRLKSFVEQNRLFE